MGTKQAKLTSHTQPSDKTHTLRCDRDAGRVPQAPIAGPSSGSNHVYIHI